MRPQHMVIEAPPPQNRRKRGGRAVLSAFDRKSDMQTAISQPDSVTPRSEESLESQPEDQLNETSPQLTTEDALKKVASMSMEPVSNPNMVIQSDHPYCSECYLPLHPDPKPEQLYIFLHAMKYTTSLGAFSTEMPEWAQEGWVWDRH